MYKILSTAVIMLFAWAFYEIGSENLKAMETCQGNHSYETCAWEILR